LAQLIPKKTKKIIINKAKIRLKYFSNIFFLFISLGTLNFTCSQNDLYIRVSQVGFLPNDMKTAVVLTNRNLDDSEFELVNSNSNKSEFKGKLQNYGTSYAGFSNSYIIDFTKVKSNGRYFLQIEDKKSFSFEIKHGVFNGITQQLLKFFKIQRCGYTNPYMHKECHPVDVTRLILPDGSPEYTKVDVTGGWHDAGDYVKFLSTIAYSTYMLMFSYEFDKERFGFDYNKDNVPDILEEAKIGLDWLLRANIRNSELITQVQDLRDHDVGWRMPEDDELAYDRPGFIGGAKNVAGLYSAALAMGARIWTDEFQYLEYANQCLDKAIKIFEASSHMPDVDSSGTGMYLDKSFSGKMALSAVELYETTGKSNYLKQAMSFADDAKSDYWWSWGDINSLAHYKIAKTNRRFVNYIYDNLRHFNAAKINNLFGEGAEHNWGSNNTLMGISLQAILYKTITGSTEFDSLNIYQRDYVLGKNPWGLSFIYNIGKNFTRNFHHQVAYFNRGELPGGFAAGPVKKSIFEGVDIKYNTSDPLSRFQTESAYYRDDRNDYITNEPTISANATAIFVFGYFSR